MRPSRLPSPAWGESWVLAASENEYVVSRLRPETVYVFAARTANEAGASGLSSGAPLEYATSEPRPPAQPAFVEEAGRPACRGAVCELRWTEPNAHGADITQYRIKYFQVSMDSAGDNPKQVRTTSPPAGLTVRECDWVKVGSASWTETMPAHVRSHSFSSLAPNSDYQFELVAVNERGESPPKALVLHTAEMEWRSEGLSTGAVVVIVLVVILLLIVAVDGACCLVNDAGVIAALSVKFCGRHPSEKKGKELAMEEGPRFVQSRSLLRTVGMDSGLLQVGGPDAAEGEGAGAAQGRDGPHDRGLGEEEHRRLILLPLLPLSFPSSCTSHSSVPRPAFAVLQTVPPAKLRGRELRGRIPC